MNNKSTIEEIEKRFDKDVERFSNLDTGQLTTIDAFFNMELIAQSIAKIYPSGSSVLDIGCGAGNYDVKLLEYINPLDITLVDLSQSMLDRAIERVGDVNSDGSVRTIKTDFRLLDFPTESFDVIIATATLHHLRDDKDWEDTFSKLFSFLKAGGSIWVFDLVQQSTDLLQEFIYHEKYGEYLIGLKDEQYRDDVFAYIEKEDTPRSLLYQLDLLRKVGFREVDVLHKHLNFASFVAFK